MKNYEVKFKGRKWGAIGACYKINDTVLANNEEDARLRLYEKYEHISELSIIGLPGPSKKAFLVDVNYCIRVVINADEKDIEAAAINAAKEKFKSNISDYLLVFHENTCEVGEDTECPYDPQHDK